MLQGKDLIVWHHPDKDKNTGHGKVHARSILKGNLYLVDAVGIAFNFTNLGIPEKIDPGIGKGLFLENPGGPQFITAVNDRDLVGKLCQVQGFLDGGVTAAYHRYFLSLVKRSVTGGTVGNPLAGEFLFSLNAQFPWSGAGTENDAQAG